MKSIIYSALGASSVLHLVDREVTEPGPGEVRVHVVVSGVNPTDWKSRMGGRGAPAASGGTVPNHDGSGVIDAVGAGVTTHRVGDRVWLALSGMDRPLGGTAQQYTVALAERVFPLPDSASFDLGASLGIPAVTAYRALTVADGGPHRLHPGALADRVVLVSGGAGAVGHAAIQLARWAGAIVIATVSSPEKAALASAAGAQHIVNYRDADAGEQIRAIAPDGVDQVVEVAISANDKLNRAVIKPRATVAMYADDRGAPFTVDIGSSMQLNLRYQFVLVYTVGIEAITAAAEDIIAAIHDGALPVGEADGLPVHRFPLAETAKAHDAVENNIVGKVLIDVE